MEHKVFFGLGLDANDGAKLERLIHSFPGGEKLPGRLTPAAHWHITLCFLGYVQEEQLKLLKELLASLGSEKAFSYQLSEIGAFPSLEQPRIVWTGIQEGIEALEDLSDLITEKVDDMGFSFDDRDFIPHLTLSRVSIRPKDLKIPEKLPENLEVKASRVILFESSTTQSGSTEYLELASVSLA